MNLPPYPGQPGQPEQPQDPGSTPPAGPPPPPPASPASPAYPPASAPPPPSYPYGGTPKPPPPAGPSGGMPPGMPPAPPYQPYQQFGGPNDASRGWSALAISSFVSSLTCCLGPLAIVLGIIAIFRTGAGKAKGRWMAVTGIVLGVLGTLAAIALVTTIAVFGERVVVSPDNATVGQCVTTEISGDEVTMIDFGCSVDHNAQIYAVLDINEADLAGNLGGLDLCISAFTPMYPGVELRESGGDFSAVIEGEAVTLGAASNDLDLAAGDRVACWLQADDDFLEGDLVP
jgi:hypothetical protein